MNKSFSAKVLILLLVVVLGGAVVFFERGGQKKTLKSDVLATVVTPASCYLSPEIDKKITDKNALLAVAKKSPQEIKNALSSIDPITGDEKLNTQKKELDTLSAQQMSEQKPSETAHIQAKKKLDGMTKPVVPSEPTIPAEPIVPSKPVLSAAPVVPTKPTAPVEPTVPTEPVAPIEPIVPSKPVLAAAPVVPTKPTAPVEPTVPTVPVAGTRYYSYYMNYYTSVSKPAYDRAKAQYDTVTKPAYDKAKKAYDDALVAKNTYDTVTKPAYNKALTEYNTAVAAKRTYDTVTKPAYDKAKKVYDTAVAAKKTYDTVTKPAYDRAKQVYDDAVAAKNTYDTVTKPAYNKALAEYNAAVAAKKTYDTVTKPAYDKAKKTYDTAVAAKKIYDDALADYTNLLAQYNQQLSEYDAYISFKSALDSYLSAAIVSLETTIDAMKKNACPGKEAQCTNKIDDDRDGIQDCDDSDCSEDAACKKDIITCTIVDNNSYKFTRSNSSKDFSQNKVSIGGKDPGYAQYEIQYSQDQYIYTADVYIDGVKVDCPAIVIQNEEDEYLPPCELMLQGLREEGQDTSHMKCTGEYSFRVEQREDTNTDTGTSPIPTIPGETGNQSFSSLLYSSIFGNWNLSSSIFGSEEPECASNQVKDADGNCIDDNSDVCSSGQEKINGSCVDICTPPQIRNPISGSCEDPQCSSGQEMVNGSCVDECISPQVRNSAGVCEDSDCPAGQEKWEDTCVYPCVYPDTRQSDGTCSAGARCGNNTVESGEECDDGNTASDDGCSDSCEKEECDEESGSGYESSFFGINISGLKSSIFSSKQCVTGCKYSNADNYVEKNPPVNKDDKSCSCNNGLDFYSSTNKDRKTCTCDNKYEVEDGACVPIKGCIYKKADNYNAQAKVDDKSCTCENKLDFYDSTNKHSNSCQCDLFYEPKNGACVKAECKNGLNKERYPTCKCWGLREIVVNGECVTPSMTKSICAGAFNICAGKFTFGAVGVDAAGRLRIPFIR